MGVLQRLTTSAGLAVGFKTYSVAEVNNPSATLEKTCSILGSHLSAGPPLASFTLFALLRLLFLFHLWSLIFGDLLLFIVCRPGQFRYFMIRIYRGATLCPSVLVL